MPTHVAFLRAVNVGKRQYPMAELRAALDAAGFEDVQTHIQTGNVFFRTRHLLSDPAYGTLRTGLRRDVLGARRPAGVGRADHELWSLAVSAVNACGACLDAHERALRAAGVERETVQEAFRIAAVVTALAVTLEAEAVLGE